ncbi:hypothetical protein BsWGS_08190 [Bradybaena similaris]
MDETFKKMLQKRVYDLLSHKYGILMLVVGAFLLTLSAFHFGQAWLEWSQEKYEAVFNSFSDNIAGKSFRDRLSAPLPIDVVYTWVNGTDPGLVQQLEQVKLSLDKKNNLSREEHCTYTNCLCMGVILHPPLPSNVVLNDLMEADSIFRNVTDLKSIQENIEGPTNMTLLILNNEAEVKQIVKLKARGWYFQGTNHTLKPAFYTSEGSLPHGILMPDIVMMSGFPATYGDGDIQQTVAARLNITDKASVMAKLYPEKGLALLQMIQSSHYELLIKGKNFTIEGKELRLSPVKLVWDLKFVVTDDVVAASRFEDNEELRYSLRSIEQFAPWVRHIFIVTNGQIPYWLNLDNPRLTIITHDEIFLNSSHLPTFSSPAIEANIHRIPGLSDKFLYLNDDVMFGSPVWPDDFFSHSTGQKLYLTWPVPNCNEGCPSTWIRDGYCDRACNSSECDWDGGDCIGSKGSVQLGAGFHGDHGRFMTDYVSYCATGCANNWLADKYCDQACNNLDCGFDIGDCGTDNYDQLHNLNLQTGQFHYVLPPGEKIGYFNLSELVGEKGKVKSATYDTNSGLRAVAVGNKFRVMTMVLNTGVNATYLKFHLVYTKDGNDTHKINLTVLVDTSVKAAKSEPISTKNKSKEAVVDIDDQLDAAAFQDVLVSQRGPVTSVIKSTDLVQPLPDGIDLGILPVFSRVPMSDALRKELEHLHEANKEGELTDLGVHVRLQELVKHFGQELDALKPKFSEQKKKFAEEEEERKLNESKTSSTVPDSTSLDDKHNKQQMDEQRPNNRYSAGIQPGLNPQIQVLQDFQNQQKQQQQQTELNNRQKRLVSNEILPPNGLYQADMPGKEISLENSQSKLQQGNLFDPINPPELTKSQPLQKSDDSAKPQIEREPAEKVKIPKSSQEFDPLRLRSGLKDPNRFAGDSRPQDSFNVYEQGKLLTGVDIIGNDTRNKETRTGRKLLAVTYWSDHRARLEEKQDRDRMKMKKDRLEAEMSDEDFLNLVNIDGAAEDMGGFPWETKREKNLGEVLQEKGQRQNDYIVEGWQGRQLLDTFGDSLRHVNRIYNKEFGITSRKVPGHMPHMIDKNIMQELQDRFPMEWDATSSHKIRSSTDMQYAFAYYYYVMGVTEEISVEQVFSMMDTDHSGALSDREIRTLAARMYDLPLYLETLTGLEAILVNCSQTVTDPTLQNFSEDQREAYYDKNMPQVTRYFFLHCDELVQVVKSKFKPVPKYKTTIVNDDDIAFKMVHTNVSHVVGQLDDIRKHPKKFICLNDNIDHRKDEARTVKAILQDFYESLVPVPSQFELPRDYRNRFLHMDELREWRLYRDRLRFWTHVALAVLVALTVLSFLGEKIDNLRRKWTNRKRRHLRMSSNSGSTASEVTSANTSSSSSEPPSPSHWHKNLIETV